MLVLDRAKGELSEYKGKAATRYDLLKKKVFESENVSGLARLDGDRFLVSNAGENIIAVIDNEGNLIQKFGESGSREGQLDDAEAFDWSHNRCLYVADKGNNRVSVFGLGGVFIQAFGRTGLSEDQRLEEPTQVYVDLKERVYVLEKRYNGIVSMFDNNGKLLKRLANKDFTYLASDDIEIVDVTVDDKALMYAADIENGRILQIDWQAGKLVSGFGSKGEQRDQIERVSSITVESIESVTED